ASGRGGAPGGGRGGAGGAASGASGSGLDLALLYTNHGLFGSSGKIPVPAAPIAHLYVPAGAAGTAMANLAARMGLESTAITLPIASPAYPAGARPARVTEQAVLAGDGPLAQGVAKKLAAEDTAASTAAPTLAPGEGALRVVDDAFGTHAALLVRGDDSGATAALALADGHLPNLWRPGKQYVSLEDVRYDLHRFFSLHSGVGQATAGLFFLNRWLDSIGTQPVSDVHAALYTELADPKLADFVRDRIAAKLHVQPTVAAASLRAGTQCCAENPDLHYDNPEFPFHQGTPVFSEDIHIPWEGTTLLDDVRGAAAKLTPGATVELRARVSEGPAERRQLEAQLHDILVKAGADPARSSVEVLDAYKQGYSWLTDEVAPALKGKPVAKLDIAVAKDVDETGIRDMYTPARWVQELYPVDEVLAKQLHLPLTAITLHEINTARPVETPTEIALADPPNPVPTPTYRATAYDAQGNVLLRRDFTVAAVMRPYSGVIPAYEDVQVDTGWVHLSSGGQTLLDQRVETDIEKFWDHYQSVTLPRVYRFVMAQAHGNLRTEYVPPFDTLKMDFQLSEPNYNIGIDKERISSIESLQEDIFYSTETFIDTLGDLKNGRPESYVGRVIPVVHPSRDGQDGEVHVAFYGKAAPNPLVELSWTDAQGQHHDQLRNLPVINEPMQPRLIGARVKVGERGIQNLTWLMPADENAYDMAAWEKLEGREQLERSMFSVQEAQGQLHWLDAMHAAGLYPDELAYRDLRHMAIELQLPRPLGAAFTTPEQRILVGWNVAPPLHPHPMIASVQPIATPAGEPNNFVQWNEPIGPAESAAILARLATYPGVNVYSMGRSYLGQVIWAADIMLPTPSALHSWAKETTLKASIVYSARQHANEVSSTSHVDKLAELLVSDPAMRKYLKQVNVVLHPIDNPDGAKLSVIEAKIMPDNLLHLGYHGALAADVSSGQGQIDPEYPESRTRRQLLEQWLPDAFLNPHGYPSHEWVQPFSEYTAWVQSRDGANSGRTWWIPRGWFTSLGYARDTTTNTYSEAVAFALRDRIVDAERQVPGLLPLETRMNARYQRWGQRFQPDNMQQPVVNGIRIYMALKGSSGPGRGGMAGAGSSAAVTWDQGYTEAPDETAHGAYMHLVASAGLAYDEVHLKYLADGKLRITRSERATPTGVTWSVVRARPILPSSEPPVPKPPDGR
ncbi:MAG: M14 family zinc carboxypeptidase, partial [Terriglobales bacterium]